MKSPPPRPSGSLAFAATDHFCPLVVDSLVTCGQGNHNSNTFFFRLSGHATNCTSFLFCIPVLTGKTCTSLFPLSAPPSLSAIFLLLQASSVWTPSLSLAPHASSMHLKSPDGQPARTQRQGVGQRKSPKLKSELNPPAMSILQDLS